MLTLYPRADDAGSSQAANRAIYECVNHGIIKNISVMAPPAASEHAAEQLKDLTDVCFGLHVTLNAEWEGVKWKPLTDPEEVSSLVDDQGYFLAAPEQYVGHIVIDEALKEAKAQLDKLRALGFRLSYLDEHMGVGVNWLPELHQALIDFGRQEGLYHADVVKPLPAIELSGDVFGNFKRRIGEYPDGELIYYTHPAFADPELEPCYNADIPKGKIPRERDAERRLLCDPETRAWLAEKNVRLASFAELTR